MKTESIHFETANGCDLPDKIKYHSPKIDYSYNSDIAYPILSETNAIPNKLKEFRQVRQLSLREVETVTGISNAYLSQLETGKVKNPSFQIVVTLLRYYNVRIII